MIRNYILVALRNMRRRKIVSIINITGLAVGLAVTILILLFVQSEVTSDSFNLKEKQIFRVNSIWKRNGEVVKHTSEPLPLGPALQAEVPGIVSAVRICWGEAVISHNGVDKREDVVFTDPDLFSIFTFPFLSGDPVTALSKPNSVVLTLKEAHAIFGNDDPLFQLLSIRVGDRNEAFTVTGILRDLPDNSSIQFRILLPVPDMPRYETLKNEWDWSYGSTYVLLQNESTVANVERDIPRFIMNHFSKSISEGQGGGWIDKTVDPLQLQLEPLSKVHFSDAKFQDEQTGNPVYSYVLSIIGLIIICVASVNFISLSLGQAAYRTREVGVRKILGAAKRGIMAQFWTESLLTTAIAFTLSLLLVELLLPVSNQISGKNFQAADLFSPSIIVLLGGLMIFVVVLAGSYPSIVLSRFRPSEVLKGNSSIGRAGTLSKVLIVTQFGLSVFLTTSAIIVWLQLKYIQSRDLGYRGSQVVAVPLDFDHNDAPRLVALLRNELTAYPGVADVSGTSATFGRGFNQTVFQYEGKAHKAYVYTADDHYISTLGLKLIEGRDFTAGSQVDSLQSVIVNEEFVKEMGWRLPAVGKVLPDWSWNGKDKINLRVVGVVKDYNFLSLHDQIAPVMLTMDPDWGVWSILIKINQDNISKTLAHVKDVFRKIGPEVPFEFSFLNDDVQKEYDADMKEGEIVGTAATLAVFISCLGLFGLALISISRRTKEVGVRKVLGASTAMLVRTLSSGFLKLVALSNILALPLAYYAGTKWLEGYAYRISVTPWIFVAAAGGTFLLSVATIVVVVVKSARANPVQSLRYE